jgi:hypothetical protein
MQLFRQQAVDHQHRLYGEVLLVPPLRWSVILALLLILLATTAAFLTWGSYSRTVTAGGTSLSADRVTLDIPASALPRVAAGQPVRLLQAATPGQERRLFHGVIEHIGPEAANSAQPYMPVTARLNRSAGRASTLTPGAAVDARIVLAPRPLLQWLISPRAPEESP